MVVPKFCLFFLDSPSPLRLSVKDFFNELDVEEARITLRSGNKAFAECEARQQAVRKPY